MKRSTIPDYYSTLNVLPSARQSEIAKAYRKLVARYHPDKHADNELKELAEEKLRQLNEAYETLSDPNRRAVYDAERRGVVSSPVGAQTGSRHTPRPFPFTRTLTLLAIVVGVFLAMRFIRSPRAMVVIGLALALAWFGPRIIRSLRKKK